MLGKIIFNLCTPKHANTSIIFSPSPELPAIPLLSLKTALHSFLSVSFPPLTQKADGDVTVLSC